MDLQLYNKNFADIYLVANTPAYLFDTLKASAGVNQLAKYSAEDLIKEFEERVKTPISNASQIAQLYAILIALSTKYVPLVDEYFAKRVAMIKFEWFPKVAEYYQKNKPSAATVQFIDLPNHILNPNTFKVSIS